MNGRARRAKRQRPPKTWISAHFAVLIVHQTCKMPQLWDGLFQPEQPVRSTDQPVCRRTAQHFSLFSKVEANYTDKASGFFRGRAVGAVCEWCVVFGLRKDEKGCRLAKIRRDARFSVHTLCCRVGI
jgi:hypothetical protein